MHTLLDLNRGCIFLSLNELKNRCTSNCSYRMATIKTRMKTESLEAIDNGQKT